MNGLAPIVFGVGVKDGLNPCNFMTCAVFIAGGLWLSRRSLPVFWFRILFVLVYVVCAFAFNFGPAQIVLFQKSFIFISKLIYFFLGAASLFLGISSLGQWYALARQSPSEIVLEKKVNTFKGAGFVAFLLSIVLAVLLSALATYWPIDNYFMILGNEAIVRGQWRMVISLLAGYVLASVWPLWLVWLFVSIKNMRPSLFRIICAAVYFTASTTVIFIFK